MDRKNPTYNSNRIGETAAADQWFDFLIGDNLADNELRGNSTDLFNTIFWVSFPGLNVNDWFSMPNKQKTEEIYLSEIRIVTSVNV